MIAIEEEILEELLNFLKILNEQLFGNISRSARRNNNGIKSFENSRKNLNISQNLQELN
jgi:hypothetical protein